MQAPNETVSTSGGRAYEVGTTELTRYVSIAFAVVFLAGCFSLTSLVFVQDLVKAAFWAIRSVRSRRFEERVAAQLAVDMDSAEATEADDDPEYADRAELDARDRGEAAKNREEKASLVV